MRSRKTLFIAALLLLATPALAAQTATISGTPAAHASPNATADITGHPPAGATVTIEQCSNDWCLVRGLGWVAADSLVNLSADLESLLPENAGFDPLKEAAPAWDDMQSPFE